MEKFNRKGINNKLGDYSYSNHSILIAPIKYLKGIDTIDQQIKSNIINPKTTQFTFEYRPRGISISCIHGFSATRIALLYDGIIYWSIENKEEIFETKSKSVIGRAVIGGLLLGPVGAIVGGVSGVGDKKKKISDIDNILYISYTENGKEYEILFSVPDKYNKKTINFFQKSLLDKYLS